MIEIIKEWNTELQERTGKFRKQANAIAERDRRILKNRDVLLRLEIEAAKVVETQSNMERQLELIETHQQEKSLVTSSNFYLVIQIVFSTSEEYEQSELIERELEQMTEQIKFIIQSLNSNQGGELDALDGMTPLDAVVRILNNQLTSLMWIDEKVSIFHHAIVWWNFLLLLLVSAVILINPSRAEEFSSRIQKLANQGSASDRELTGPRIWMS
ncbi:Nuclear pore complex protein [Arachis hypogaea]|nr:Nuclear pore complex protein [Arachis hypogaea]